MDLTLKRTQALESGIFGELLDSNNRLMAVSLEHAYKSFVGGWIAKIPLGTFTCVRGEHYLHGMTTPFETFEVTGIDGHAGLLFHWGNFSKDSEGCILVGTNVVGPIGGAKMITQSRAAFARLMRLQSGIQTFQLRVIGA